MFVDASEILLQALTLQHLCKAKKKQTQNMNDNRLLLTIWSYNYHVSITFKWVRFHGRFVQMFQLKCHIIHLLTMIPFCVDSLRFGEKEITWCQPFSIFIFNISVGVFYWCSSKKSSSTFFFAVALQTMFKYIRSYRENK